jgi:hypothetical protein
LGFQLLLQEIAMRHSSLGGDPRATPGGGEWIKHAMGRSEERPLQATGYGTGIAGASATRILDRIDSALPTMFGQ